jgi:hypothetical protein
MMGPSLAVLAPLALCAGGVALFLFRASPRATVVAWTIVLFFVPVWVGVSIGFFWAAITLVTLVAIVTNLSDIRLSAVDGLVFAFATLVLILFALRAATLSNAVIALLEWVVPYVWGRLVLARVPRGFVARTIAVVALLAAVLAIVEFATGFNAFVLIPGQGNMEVWATLQERASFLRAEGAFGHSIALGASLAMASAFVIGQRWPTPVLVLALATIVGAIVVTFSRIGLASVAIVVTLSLLLLPELRRTTRWAIASAGALAVGVVVPFVGDVFLDAGEEASGSADYRTQLLSLVSRVRVLGAAEDWGGRAVGGVYLGDPSRSIDNSLLLIALRFGWLPVALVVAILLAVALIAVSRRSNPAAVAVTAQIPTLVVVALITQFGMFLWFLVGLAVAWRFFPDDPPPLGTDLRAIEIPPPRRRPAAGARP